MRVLGIQRRFTLAVGVMLGLAPLGGLAKTAAKKPAKPSASKVSPGSKPSSEARPNAPSPSSTGNSRGPLDLAARGAIVIDAWSGEPFFEKNADARFYPASTTKIMTAMLVIETGNLDAEVEVTEEDARVGESSLSIRPGERFTRRQMLYGLMLKSANDVAHALGRENAGTVAEFARKMTARARELGCENTRFENPHGLHHAEHYTTPRDLASITRAAMAQPLFREIVATRAAPWAASRGTFSMANHNRLLGRFPGCIGVKTGYTIPAQQVLASAAQREGREAIAVVMHTNKPGIWDDSSKLLEFALSRKPE